MKPRFIISPEAERYIRESLQHAPPEGMEPSLGLTFRRTVHDKHGKLVERCDREHYSFGYSPPSRHTAHIYYELFGHRVAFHPTTLESVTGKRLVLGRTDPIDGVEHTNEVLVALPNDEIASET